MRLIERQFLFISACEAMLRSKTKSDSGALLEGAVLTSREIALGLTAAILHAMPATFEAMRKKNARGPASGHTMNNAAWRSTWHDRRRNQCLPVSD